MRKKYAALNKVNDEISQENVTLKRRINTLAKQVPSVNDIKSEKSGLTNFENDLRGVS